MTFSLPNILRLLRTIYKKNSNKQHRGKYTASTFLLSFSRLLCIFRVGKCVRDVVKCSINSMVTKQSNKHTPLWHIKHKIHTQTKHAKRFPLFLSLVLWQFSSFAYIEFNQCNLPTSQVQLFLHELRLTLTDFIVEIAWNCGISSFIHWNKPQALVCDMRPSTHLP